MTNSVTKQVEDKAVFLYNELPYEAKEELLSRAYAETFRNVEVEQSLLGTLLVQNAAIFQIPDLQPKHFSSDHTREVFQDLQMMIAAGRTANPATLAAKYDSDPMFEELGGRQYLSALAARAITAMGAADYALILIEEYNNKTAYEALVAAQKAMRQRAVDGSAARPIQALLGSILELHETLTDKRIKTISEVASNVASAMTQGDDPDSTGIAEIDKTLAGGLHRKKVYDFTAKMKTGKTMLLTTLYTNVQKTILKEMADLEFARQNGMDAPLTPIQPVLYICAEMGEEQITQRIMARIMGVNAMGFLTKKNEDGFQAQVEDCRQSQELAQMPGLFYNAKGITMSELRTVLTIAVHRHHIRGFVLDSFNLVDPDKRDRYESSVKFSEHLAKWLMDFVDINNIWCITANQINESTGRVRGGSPSAMYFDAQFELQRDESTDEAWIKTNYIRYAPKRDVGDARHPSLRMMKEGPYFAGIKELEAQKNTLHHELEEVEI